MRKKERKSYHMDPDVIDIIDRAVALYGVSAASIVNRSIRKTFGNPIKEVVSRFNEMKPEYERLKSIIDAHKAKQRDEIKQQKEKKIFKGEFSDKEKKIFDELVTQ